MWLEVLSLATEALGMPVVIFSWTWSSLSTENQGERIKKGEGGEEMGIKRMRCNDTQLYFLYLWFFHQEPLSHSFHILSPVFPLLVVCVGVKVLSPSSQPDATQSLNSVQRRMPLKTVPDYDDTVKEREGERKLGKNRPWKEKEIRCTLLLYTFILGSTNESEEKDRAGRSHDSLEMLENWSLASRGFLSLSTINIWGWIICGRACAVLKHCCTVWHLAAFLASTLASVCMTTKTVCRYCQMSMQEQSLPCWAPLHFPDEENEAQSGRNLLKAAQSQDKNLDCCHKIWSFAQKSHVFRKISALYKANSNEKQQKNNHAILVIQQQVERSILGCEWVLGQSAPRVLTSMRVLWSTSSKRCWDKICEFSFYLCQIH